MQRMPQKIDLRDFKNQTTKWTVSLFFQTSRKSETSRRNATDYLYPYCHHLYQFRGQKWDRVPIM